MDDPSLCPSASETASVCSLDALESKEEIHHHQGADVEMGTTGIYGGAAHVAFNAPSPIASLSNVRKRNIPRTTHPSTKAIFAMGFMAVVGLLSIGYTLDVHGDLVPTTIFHQPSMSFGLFLCIIMIIFYFAAIGMIVQELCPSIFRVLNLIAFVLLVLGVTVLLWTLIPDNFSWVPWFLFSCTVMAALGVLIYEWFGRIQSVINLDDE